MADRYSGVNGLIYWKSISDLSPETTLIVIPKIIDFCMSESPTDLFFERLGERMWTLLSGIARQAARGRTQMLLKRLSETSFHNVYLTK
jgi:hypothetical protein